VVRQVSWLFAVSQLLVLLVPVVLTIAKWVAIGVISILAIAALFVLFRERG
jgi:hypothetical protein